MTESLTGSLTCERRGAAVERRGVRDSRPVGGRWVGHSVAIRDRQVAMCGHRVIILRGDHVVIKCQSDGNQVVISNSQVVAIWEYQGAKWFKRQSSNAISSNAIPSNAIASNAIASNARASNAIASSNAIVRSAIASNAIVRSAIVRSAACNDGGQPRALTL